MNKNEPLGLPRGSVRAILALMVTASTLAYFFIHQAFPTELVGLATLVVAYYFVKRGADDFVSPPTESLPEPYTGDGE